MADELQKWLQSLPAAAIEKELDQLRKQAAELSLKIELREQALGMSKSLSPKEIDYVEQARENNPWRGVRAISANPPFRGREAVRRVIAQTPDQKRWTIPEMLEAILVRGWSANTHAVQVNLSRMYRDGELEKDGVGVYIVPD